MRWCGTIGVFDIDYFNFVNVDVSKMNANVWLAFLFRVLRKGK